MRRILMAMLMFCTTAGSHAQPSSAHYVSLKSWAKNNQFTASRLGARDIILRSRDGRTRCLFESQRRECTWNGIKVFLGWPITPSLYDPKIANADIAKMLVPLLHSAQPHTVRKIAIDPGHGGDDVGTQHNGLVEKELTLDLAFRLKRILERYGFDVIMTRTNDTFVNLETRAKIVNAAQADLCVAIHINSEPTPNCTAHGLETFILTPAGQPSSCDRRAIGAETDAFSGNRHDIQNIHLGYAIHSILCKQLNVNDRGLKRARFKVLKEINCPAAYLECGFISNKSDANRLRSEEYRQHFAETVARGIVAYQRGKLSS